ncbi:MAG: DUF1294 domain-containing protein [Firmicutes bacterium]|nr:DUF1294 domain-containing protein [Bacillota bacterium]
MEYVILIIWNIFVFAVYGIDKFNAINGRWRISEKTLLMLAFLMGGLGAYFGMQFFRHKTKHIKFTLLVPFAILVNVTAVYFIGRGFV